MSKPVVYITREIPKIGLEILQDYCQVRMNQKDRSLTKREVIEMAQKADGLLTMLNNPIDEEVIDSCSDLKVISNYAVGYNNIDVEYATEKGIVVTNTPGVLTETTADLAWALLLAVARRIVESDDFTRKGKFDGWYPKLMLGTEVSGKTLGIIGLGRIGKAVAKRAQGFNMKVVYNNRTPLDKREEDKLDLNHLELDQLLQTADFVSINAPLNDSTYHLIAGEEFKKMKQNAIIINTGRGPIIDEVGLVNALKTGEIAGAGLDVYEDEPEVQEGLKELNNVVLTPHTGSGTIETREKMAEMAANNIIAVLKGNKIPNPVNPSLVDK